MGLSQDQPPQSQNSEAEKKYKLKDKIMLKPQIDQLTGIAYAFGISLFVMTITVVANVKEMTKMREELELLREQIERRAI